MSEVRAITIRQPYAWAVATGHKRVENRTVFTPWRGLLLIHAANVWHAEGSADPVVAAAWGTEVARLGIGPATARTGPYTGPVHPVPNPDHFPRGVIAVARLTGVHEATDGCCAPWGWPGRPKPPTMAEMATGKPILDLLRGEGGVQPSRPIAHWDLADVRRLTEPVPTKGKLGLWRPDPELMRLVRARLP